MIRAGLAVGLAAALLFGSVPATAQETITTTAVEGAVLLVPQDDGTMTWRGRTFSGPFEIKAADDGLVIIEHLPLDRYLLGIQEVPFSWHEEALRAQAVAARTFLARTISNGRTGAAGQYGFDICATDQCQVYRGLDKVLGADGDRWEAAVLDTATEILIFDGRPALAMYSSTAGPRTRSIEDVFGRDPTPYLTAVASPGENSPYVSWTVPVPAPWMEAILIDAELMTGALSELVVQQTADGDGAWTVDITATGSADDPGSWSFRRALNASGPRILPDDLPASRPDGRAYPQTVLSPTFTIDRTWDVSNDFSTGYVESNATYLINGSGWGHQVGMSQYGAQAMASSGSSYQDILSHYYSGLVPEPAGQQLPDEVAVGLDWAEETYEITATTPFDIMADGELIAEGVTGTWAFTHAGRTVEVIPPGGFGLPPTLSGIPVVSDHAAGFVVQVVGELSKPGDTRFVVFRGPVVVHESDWRTHDAGPVSFVWDAFIGDAPAPPGPYRVLFYTRDDNGSTTQTAVFWIGR